MPLGHDSGWAFDSAGGMIFQLGVDTGDSTEELEGMTRGTRLERVRSISTFWSTTDGVQKPSGMWQLGRQVTAHGHA